MASLLGPLRRDPLGALARLHEQGDVARTRVGRQELVVVFAPEAVRELLVERARSFVKQNVLAASGAPPADPGGLLRAFDWETHVAARRLLHDSFRRSRIAALEGEIRTIAAEAVGGWPTGEPFAVEESLGEAAVAALGLVLAAPIADPGGFYHDVTCRMRAFRLASSVPRDLPRVLLRRRTDDALDVRLRLRCRELLAGAEPGGAAAVIRDNLDTADAESEVLGFVAAGSETTTSAVASALWLLAGHRQEQEALRADVGQGSTARARAVMAETLRLCPPSWFIGRRAVVDEELAGEPIAAGTVVLVPVARLQRDPSRYERPEEFEPSRWLAAEPPADAFVPFGLGLRRCLGEALAWLEGDAFLAETARRGRLELAPGASVRLRAGASLAPAGLRLRLVSA